MIPRYKLYVIVYVSDMIEKQNAKKKKIKKEKSLSPTNSLFSLINQVLIMVLLGKKPV